jgi:hypothetical protein
MLKRILLSSLALVLFAPLHAMAQGACYPAGVVLLDTGRPANGATVSVCTAGGTFPGCTSTTSLFTTPALSVAASNPVTTDTHGNFGFCAAAGVNYDLQITGTGITPLTIKNLPLPPTSPITAASLTRSSWPAAIAWTGATTRTPEIYSCARRRQMNSTPRLSPT